MVKRLAMSVFVAVALLGINVPLPAIGSTPHHAGRVLINAPEMPAVDTSPPPLPADAPVKHPVAPATSGKPNHVSAFSANDVAKLGQHGLKVLDNRDGQWQVEAKLNGQDRVLTMVDGVLPSGREVVGFGSEPVSNASAPTSLVRALNVRANTNYFFICSYSYMNYYWDDLHVHLCAVDANYTLAIIAALEMAIGGLVGVWMGGAVGGVVGIASGTILAIITIGYWWLHSDSQGNVDIVIPHWTMEPPFGGYMHWINGGLWDYMYDQCWIYDMNHWYAPRCRN